MSVSAAVGAASECMLGVPVIALAQLESDVLDSALRYGAFYHRLWGSMPFPMAGDGSCGNCRGEVLNCRGAWWPFQQAEVVLVDFLELFWPFRL